MFPAHQIIFVVWRYGDLVPLFYPPNLDYLTVGVNHPYPGILMNDHLGPFLEKKPIKGESFTQNIL
jgi:hypothetical protein